MDDFRYFYRDEQNFITSDGDKTTDERHMALIL